jgi:hypothetical protein
MRRITRGKVPTGRTHPVHALVCDLRAQRRALRRYREWLEKRPHLDHHLPAAETQR